MHIRFITKNRSNPAYHGAIVGATRVASRHGATVDAVAPETPDDIAEQIALIDASIAERPDAIVLLPAHRSALTEAIGRINAAGIPLLLMVSEADTGNWISFVSTDSELMAYELGVHTLRTLAADANIVIMDGHPNAITTAERHNGFRRALAEYPGMTLLGCTAGQYQHAPAHAAALRMLDEYPRIDAVLVANDLMGMGVIQALEERGRTATVCSINGTPDAVSAIRRKKLFATASFNTHAFGCLVTEAAIRHLKGERVPARIVLPADIIDPQNAANWDVPYEARDCIAWPGAMTKNT